MANDKPTQFDVATLAQVSQSTVSAILRQPGRAGSFDPSTRARVIQAARQLNYRPHLAGMSLRSGRTFAIAMAVPAYESITHTIQARIFQGAGERARELGYTLSISTYRHDETQHDDIRLSFRSMLQEARFDGALIYGLFSGESDVREEVLDELHLPHVVLERTSDFSPSINFDHFAGGRMATEHLIRLGRKRIVFLGDNETRTPMHDRCLGYQQALAAAGLEVEPARICAMPNRASYYDMGLGMVHRLLDSRVAFDGVVAAADEFAMLAIQALHARGLRVPEDVAIVGYDDSAAATLASPPLTSVYQDGVAMGRQAMDMLEALIRPAQTSPAAEDFSSDERKDLAADARQQRIIMPELIVRRSCGSPM